MGREEWVKGRAVGRGAFGTVNLATCCNSSSIFNPHHHLPSLFAVKSAISSSSSSLQNEAFILSQIPHSPRIVRCFGGEWTPGQSNDGAFNLFLEYVSGGSLSDLCRRSGKLDELTVRRYAREILEGLAHVHRHAFVHCDIKPSNILVDPSSGVKIADFGLAKRSGEKASGKPTIQGTPMYISPEVAAGEEPEPPSDVWSLGCTLVELASGKPPWEVPAGDGGSVVQLLYRIGISEESPEIPSNLSEQGKDFLRRCLERDPRRRWTADMLLRHEFVNLSREDEASIGAIGMLEGLESPKGALDSLWWRHSFQSSSSSAASCSSYSSPPKASDSTPQTATNWPESSNSPAERIRQLAGSQDPRWSGGVCGRWVPVREAT
uniref:Protein kinase domain-containing protein n=2 Tax=Nymphaea colorata TaxID=210225 RepID=A0A5K1F5B4_9MAGN|nr:unnamed protein product [Nymphaea colorata]